MEEYWKKKDFHKNVSYRSFIPRRQNILLANYQKKGQNVVLFQNKIKMYTILNKRCNLTTLLPTELRKKNYILQQHKVKRTSIHFL